MIKAIVFDFDGTLSSEREYIYGCFRFVESEIQHRFGITEAAEKLINLFNESWNDTFGRLLMQEEVKYTDKDIKKLVQIYRQAPPVVHLYDDTIIALQTLRNKGIKTAVLTNGFYEIQKEKIRKSNLQILLDAVEIPDLHGREFWKPDIRRVVELLGLLNLKAEETLYIGDSDSDFKVAHASGMQMGFIKRQDSVTEFHYKDNADYILNSLLELEEII